MLQKRQERLGAVYYRGKILETQNLSTGHRVPLIGEES